jgi:hypothetical protein
MIPTAEQMRAEPAARSGLFSTDRTGLFLAAVALSIVPLWFGAYLPMVDLPGHAAVITALQQLAIGNPLFTSVFDVDWFTPYLLGYLPVYALASVMPVAMAIQVVVSLSVAAVPLLTAVLLRDGGADSRWKWLAIPGSYSFAFYWGFLSFLVAAPFALLLLVWTIRFERRQSVASALIVAAFTVILFFSHVIVMGFACLLALTYLIGREHRNVRRLFWLCLPYTVPIPLIAIWLLPRLANESVIADAPVVYGSLVERVSLLFAQPAGAEVLSWPALAITVLIFALPPLAGATFARSPARWLPFAVVLLSFLTIPSFAFAAGFLYERLGIFLAPLWLLCWNAPISGKHRFGWIAIPLVAVWLLSNTGRFAIFADETKYFDDVVSAMEPGKRVAALIVDNRTPLFGTPVYRHFGSWYQTLKGGVVDFNFADFRLVLRRKDMAQPRVDEYLSWYPWLFDWNVYGGADYDYFLVKADDGGSALLFAGKRESVRLVKQSGWWFVYENLERRKPDGRVSQSP